MRTVLTFNNSEALPSLDNVLQEIDANDNYRKIVLPILDECNKIIKIVSLIETIEKDAFKEMLFADISAPINNITDSSYLISLFVLTLGNEISEKITTLFNKNEFLSAYITDVIASMTAERAVSNLESNFFDILKIDKNGFLALSYSPGYCGWDIRSQKNIFSYLKPEEIGLRINEYFLMEPLKSVSGALVIAEKEKHFFEPNFKFCSNCKTVKCRLKRG